MQLDGMTLRHETCIARNRRRFLHRYPSNFQFRHYVQWFLALTNRARYSGAQCLPPIMIVPRAHFTWLVRFNPNSEYQWR